jgi:hypothetical protein
MRVSSSFYAPQKYERAMFPKVPWARGSTPPVIPSEEPRSGDDERSAFVRVEISGRRPKPPLFLMNL